MVIGKGVVEGERRNGKERNEERKRQEGCFVIMSILLLLLQRT